MAFTNLATKLIQSNIQTHGATGEQIGFGENYIFHKFAWQVELQVGTDEAKGMFSTGPLVAKTCELPRFSIDTQVINAYNHKTIVQTKMNYEPITMTFYDQVNGTAESLIWSFVKKQFDSTDASKKAGVLDDMPLTVTITLKNLGGEGDDKVYVLKNAYIVDAQHDTLDYGTSDPVLWTLTLRYEDLEAPEFNEATPGDKGAGIAALPKPPSRPVVGAMPTPPTQPPKADAKKEIESDKKRLLTTWEAEGLPTTAAEIYGTDPYGTDDASSIMAVAGQNKTKPAPSKVTSWPEVDAMGNVTGYESAFVTTGNPSGNTQTSSKPTSPSTGTATTKIQSGLTAQQAADARAAYAQNDPRRLDGASGINQKYKESYANNYAREIARIPPNASPQTRERMERKAANVADLRARVDSPKYTSQVRTQNADGSFTDRAVLQPQSVNNPSTAASQGAKEKKFVNLSNGGDY